MRPLYIFDLDGTLALVDHRRHLVEERACEKCFATGLTAGIATSGGSRRVDQCQACGGTGRTKADWPAFYAACVDDQPNVPVIRTLQALRSSDAEIWIWSGRSDEVRQQTVDWVHRHIGYVGLRSGLLWFTAPEAFLMRKAGDFTPDDELKLGWLAGLEPPERARLTAVFDDRDKVVAMWRQHGVPCFQVTEGAF